METLAIAAYKQPVTKAEIDDIRGVNCAQYIRQLLEDEFIQYAGKKNVLGKPNLYKTTSRFLIQFGLKNLTDLPTMKEIKSYDFLEDDGEDLLNPDRSEEEEGFDQEDVDENDSKTESSENTENSSKQDESEPKSQSKVDSEEKHEGTAQPKDSSDQSKPAIDTESTDEATPSADESPDTASDQPSDETSSKN